MASDPFLGRAIGNRSVMEINGRYHRFALECESIMNASTGVGNRVVFAIDFEANYIIHGTYLR